MFKLFIVKVINNLLKPHLIPLKFFSKCNYFFKSITYKQNKFENEQNNIFHYYGLNRLDGIKNLNLIKKKFDKKYINHEMSSEHEVVFSSISLNKKFSVVDILEIGTFNGYNAFLLSNLFPDANVDTIDLPESDEDFINFYNRKNNLENFIKNRNDILSKKKNIAFFELNSLKLLNFKKKYDLIWIDGAHGYPFVCIDIINSLNIIKQNGLILCDDIHLKLNYITSDKMYNSIAAIETLNELSRQNLINLKLIYKRLDAKNNCIKNQRKFIAIFQKI